MKPESAKISTKKTITADVVRDDPLRTLRALALTSEIIYGTPASTRDPARFSFAHGGKDGTPFPVDTGTYDKTVEVLRAAVNRAGIDRSERARALKRLVKFGEERVRERMRAEPRHPSPDHRLPDHKSPDHPSPDRR